ncbi:hypothetical protein AB0B56_41395 [Streptosporangium canum]
MAVPAFLNPRAGDAAPLIDDGVSVTEAARTLKIGRSTAYAALAQR